MDANTTYKIIQYAANKNQNGYVGPDDFSIIINQGQLSFLKWLIGETQSYMPGRPISKVELGNDQHVLQSLAPLIYPPTTLTIPADGEVLWPSNMEEVVAMYTTDMDRIRFVQQDSLWSYLKSVIDPVENKPIYLINKNVFQFYPLTLGAAKVSFISTPPEIVWAYTLDVNGRPVYDEINSVAPVWADTDMMEVIARALRLVGVNLQAADVSVYANEIKNIGQ